ncbi:MAG TPA: hypothetical protein VMY59_00025 [Candidatus Thermoplasmatota archaeon]|nr:hypothetical protein [Candidatus Thermoplasmatota archaeon]
MKNEKSAYLKLLEHYGYGEYIRLIDIIHKKPNITAVELITKFNFNKRVYTRLKTLEKLKIIKIEKEHINVRER